MFDRIFHRLNSLTAWTTAVAVCHVGLGVSLATAQVDAASGDHWVTFGQQSTDVVGRREFPSLEESSRLVVAAVAEFETYLNQRTNSQRAADWLDYVRTDALVDAIGANKPASEIATAARDLHNRLVGDVVGLEMLPLQKLRQETETLLAALRFADREGAVRQVEQQIESLVERLANGNGNSSAEESAAISALVQSLDQSNQVPDLVNEAYKAYAHPNLVVTVAGHVVQSAIQREVDRQRPVRDCILGTRIIGNGRLQGRVEGKLVPCDGRVQIDLVLTGRFRSDTVGYNGPVRLPTISNGNITAIRSLWVGELGTDISPPSSVVSFQSQITSIQHPLRIVRRIASNQVAQKKSRAEAIGREKFRNEVVSDFTRQTTEALQGLSDRPADSRPIEQIQVRFARLNLDPPVRSIGSTANTVRIAAIQRTGKQLGAPDEPPTFHDIVGTRLASTQNQQSSTPVSSLPNRFKPEPSFNPGSYDSFDAVIQVHESLIDNVAARILAGRTFTGNQIDALLAQRDRSKLPSILKKLNTEAILPKLSGEEPADEAESFEIDFSRFRPIVFEARDQSVRIGIRGTRFSQDGRELRSALEITATYVPEEENGHLVLRRSGDVGVDFPGGRRLTVQQVALRRSIQRLFSERFPEKFLDLPLIVPPSVPLSHLWGKLYHAHQIDARNGWLSISVR